MRKGLLVILIALLSYLSSITHVFAFDASFFLRNTKNKEICVVFMQRKPYEYSINNHGIRSYTGLDFKILESILNIDQTFEHSTLDWADALASIKEGSCDIMFGAFFNPERAKYAYYSLPYRHSSDGLYVHRYGNTKIKDLNDLFTQIREKKFRLAVIKDLIYTAPGLNDFVKANPTLIPTVPKLQNLIELMLKNKIDGFFGDKMIVQTYLWQSQLYKKISNYPIDTKEYPVHMLFSKKSFSPETIKLFNQHLAEFKNTAKYTQLFRTYSVPIFIGMTTDTWGYHLLEILGTIFFAISGLLLAREVNFNFTGAFILAMLPGIGGGLLRDIIINRDPPSLFRAPIYFLAVFFTTIFIYLIIRAAQYFKVASLNNIINTIDKQLAEGNFLIIRITDALGVAVFTIIGVMVAVEVQITPLLLWAPILAVISSTGGGILRDFFMGRDLNHTFYYETPFIWSFLLTAYIMVRTMSMTAHEITYAIIATMIGIVLTRFVILKKGWVTKPFWPPVT